MDDATPRTTSDLTVGGGTVADEVTGAANPVTAERPLVVLAHGTGDDRRAHRFAALVELAPFTREQSIGRREPASSAYRRGATQLLATTVLGSTRAWARDLDLAYPVSEHGTEPVDHDQRLAGLTMAALAERVGVRAPSLYKHVAGQGDLVRRIAAGALRTFVVSHPGRCGATIGVRPDHGDPHDTAPTASRSTPHQTRVLRAHHVAVPWRSMKRPVGPVVSSAALTTASRAAGRTPRRGAPAARRGARRAAGAPRDRRALPDTERFVHPEVGSLNLQRQTLVDPGQAHQPLVGAAAPGTGSHDRLRLLSVLGPQGLSRRRPPAGP